MPPTTEEIQKRREKSAWWRAVLGEYPTGVCLIASRDRENEPIGLIVGSFVAVSEEPPLIGFFAGTHSSSLPALVDSGRFSVSVLSEKSEPFARAFTQKAPDRWEMTTPVDSATGTPRLADSVVWFDASIEDTHTYGDHIFVVGRVQDFGTGSAAAEMPLLFRRAGYGTFAAPSENYDARAFIERLRWATGAEREIEALANDLDVEVTVTTQLGDSVVTLASVRPRSSLSSYQNVGASHPWAAPIASIFAAWAPKPQRHAWEEASRHLTGSVDRELIRGLLHGVRERGYAVAGDLDLTERFLRLTRESDAGRDSYARMWAQIATSKRELETEDGIDWRKVAVVQVPVFGPNGDVVLGLYAIGLPATTDAASSEHLVQRILRTADGISKSILEGQIAHRPPATETLMWGDWWDS